jgi:hypothetical protein
VQRGAGLASGMKTNIVVAFEYVCMCAAPVLLAWEWLRSFRRRSISLIIASVSCIWMLFSLVWRGALGPDYSNAHAYIIAANLVAVMLTAIASALIRSQRSVRTVFAAVMLGFVWFVALAIMYAV